MACFIVPATEAVITTITTKIVASKEQRADTADSTKKESENEGHISFSAKLKWLSNLLWGGSILLAFEHVWHGEVVPWFPFLTAVNNPEDMAEMLHEMATAGVWMAVLVTIIWIGMIFVSSAIEKRTAPSIPEMNRR